MARAESYEPLPQRRKERKAANGKPYASGNVSVLAKWAAKNKAKGLLLNSYINSILLLNTVQ